MFYETVRMDDAKYHVFQFTKTALFQCLAFFYQAQTADRMSV